MKTPQWIRNSLEKFEAQPTPYSEVEIAEVLSAERNKLGDIKDEDEWNAFLAEHSAFFLVESREGQSVWGTYFAPMAEWNSGTETVRNPDVTKLSAQTITYWERRSAECKSSVMKARYADAAWDLAKVVANQKPNYECAKTAIDGYVDAVKLRFEKMEFESVVRLRRALELARSIADTARIKTVVDSMFEFYYKSLNPRHAGIWIFLFDNLYGERKLISESQQAEIIKNLESLLGILIAMDDSGRFDPFGAQAAAERLAQHYRRLGDTANVERVVRAYGDAFVKMAEDASPMLAIAWLQPVAERYEQEGMRQAAEEVRLQLMKKGRDIGSDMKEYSVSVQIEKNDSDRLVNELLVEGDIRTTLSKVAAYFIPTATAAREILAEQKTIAPLMSLIPITVMDAEGRPVAKIGSIDEDAEGRLLRQIAQNVGFFQPLLSHVLRRMFEGFKPAVDDILDALYRSPLYLEARRAILKEGIEAYLARDFVKCIHVLVLQIEEILRTLMVLMGIPPLKNVPRHPGISDVKNMNDALSDSRIRDVLSENVWRYLTVVYIDRIGMNLRNDLAHGIVSIEAFNQATADLVLHTLLVLSLYRSRGQRQDASSDPSRPSVA